jgi:hypothetical protein
MSSIFGDSRVGILWVVYLLAQNSIPGWCSWDIGISDFC